MVGFIQRFDRAYIPRQCVLETTLACNLRCHHCGSRAGAARPNELSTGELLDLFSQLAALGCERVTLSGGEPTMRSDWPELIEGVVRAGMRVGMFTNALRFDKDAALSAKAKGLESVAFSMDGLEATHDRVRGKSGHFNRLLLAMQHAKDASLPFSVVTHVNNLNLTELEPLHDLIVEKGAHAWQVQLGTNMGNMSDHPELLLAPKKLVTLEQVLVRMKKRKKIRVVASDSVGYFGPGEKVLRDQNPGRCFGGCHAGMSNIGIESNGNVKGCLSIMAGYNVGGEAFVEGNIRSEPLADIWNRKGAFAYNRNWSKETLGGFCKTCNHAEKCRGGCRAKMAASGGSLENPMCVYRVYVENGILTQRRHNRVAAAVLISMLSSAAAGCSDNKTGAVDAGKDTSPDSVDTAADYSDPGYESDTVADYSDPGYESDTVADYSDPGYETDVVADYSDPGYESDTVADYSDPGYETDVVADYSDPGYESDTVADYSDPGYETDVVADYSDPGCDVDGGADDAGVDGGDLDS